MKRFRLSKIPKWSKLPRWLKPKPAPHKGLQISKVLLVTTIVLPLMLVGSDMVSDGCVLSQMWPYTFYAKLLAGAYSGNSTGGANISGAAVNEERNMTVNDTGITNSTASEALEDVVLYSLFVVSIMILVASTVNLLRSNPLATLVRNARTTVMMNSRELERKDVPMPLGNS